VAGDATVVLCEAVAPNKSIPGPFAVWVFSLVTQKASPVVGHSIVLLEMDDRALASRFLLFLLNAAAAAALCASAGAAFATLPDEERADLLLAAFIACSPNTFRQYSSPWYQGETREMLDACAQSAWAEEPETPPADPPLVCWLHGPLPCIHRTSCAG
jgi:hypothetical protein